jgi:excisionase family DNA binding protein
MEKKFMDIEEAAEFTGLSRPTLSWYVERNAIPSHKVGGRRIFDRDDLITWIKSFNSQGVMFRIEEKKPNEKGT